MVSEAPQGTANSVQLSQCSPDFSNNRCDNESAKETHPPRADEQADFGIKVALAKAYPSRIHGLGRFSGRVGSRQIGSWRHSAETAMWPLTVVHLQPLLGHVPELRRPKELGRENAKLKRMYAEVALGRAASDKLQAASR